jgi:hypothetical protein
VRDGASTHVAHSGVIDFTDDEWRHCRIEVRGGAVSVYVEGTKVLDSVAVPPAAAGELVGLSSATGAGGGTFVVDNFVVRTHWSTAVPPHLWSLYR